MSDQPLTTYVPEVEALSAALLKRGAALGLSNSDVRRGFNATANSLSNYAITLTLVHAAQKLGRGSFTVVVDGVPERINDEILPRIVNALFRDNDKPGMTLWNSYRG